MFLIKRKNLKILNFYTIVNIYTIFLVILFWYKLLYDSLLCQSNQIIPQ